MATRLRQWIRHTTTERLKVKGEWMHSSRVGLAPQKIAETDEQDATRDTYQRKVFYDYLISKNFFVVYWTGSPTKQVRYVASLNGLEWTSPTMLWSFSVGPFYGGNIDIQYPNKAEEHDLYDQPFHFYISFSGSNGNTWYVNCMVISSNNLSPISGSSLSSGGTGGNIISTKNSHLWIYNRKPSGPLIIGYWATECSTTYNVTYSTSTGGAVVMPYQPYTLQRVLALAKGADDNLYYARATDTGAFLESFNILATLKTGFSTFSAASEAQNIGDPEIVDMVYIKSTGELVHRSYLNDALTGETVLCQSGAGYPVIAIGKGGRRYVFYVKDGVIKMQKLLNINGAVLILSPERTLFPKHNYKNPAYLSSNQNVQDGKICLVWTEGFEAPYEVWFAYLEDR